MRVCPKCEKSTRVSERIEQDRQEKKTWLITYCAKCGFNYDLQEYVGEYLSPQQEMDKHKWPGSADQHNIQKYWPTL